MHAQKENLKVLYICQRDEAKEGGAVRVAIGYLKKLSEFDVDAHCLFLYGSSGYFGATLGARAHYLNIASSRDIFKLWQLPKFINKFRPDIVHHHDGLFWPQLLSFFHRNYKKIVHSHIWPDKKDLTIELRILNKLIRYSVDMIICTSEEAKKYYHFKIGVPLSRLKTIYYGIDSSNYKQATKCLKNEARKKLNISQGMPVVGFVGRLHDRMKGVSDFLRVVAQLPEQFMGIIAGDGPDLKYLKEYSKELKIDNRVKFLGFLHDPKNAFYAMDVFCFTSHKEPFGLTVLEAMLCNVPVVGFYCEGGVHEILDNEVGVLIYNRDILAFANAAEEACGSGLKWDKKIQIANKRIHEKFNIEKSTMELHKVYKAMTANI